MIRRGPSIGRLMVITGVLAADIAVLRAVWSDSWSPLIAIAVLPTLDLVILASPYAWRPGPRRPFWAGFVAGGLLAVLGFVGLVQAQGPRMLVFMPILVIGGWLSNFIKNYQYNINHPLWIGLMTALYITIFTPPQILVAWTAGRITQRYRSSLRGERRATAPPSSGEVST